MLFMCHDLQQEIKSWYSLERQLICFTKSHVLLICNSSRRVEIDFGHITHDWEACRLRSGFGRALAVFAGIK